jgi:predicted TIM-barrel fold metal-dependent hydrolase
MSIEYIAPEHRGGNLHARSQEELLRWHDQGSEPVIEPELPVIDPHMHFYDRPDAQYLAEDFKHEAIGSGHAIKGCVFVECGFAYTYGSGNEAAVAETNRVADLSSRPGSQNFPLAIVAHADLAAPDIDKILRAHVTAGKGKFRGIRQRAVWDPEVRPDTPGLRSHLLLDRDFRRGFSILTDMGLSFDAWQYYGQLEELADLAASFPDANIIANHTGGPLGIASHAHDMDRVWSTWRKGIERLARHNNVSMKLGGLGMLHCGYDVHFSEQPPSSEQLADLWRVPLDFCMDAFGAARCMFESNFPPDRQSASYRVVWNTFKRISASRSKEERSRLFYQTANERYRLNLGPA